MGELRETSACAGLLPITLGQVTLEEMAVGQMTSLSPFGEASALSSALQKAHGISLPAPGQSTTAEGVRCIWFGRDEVMLIGPAPAAALGESAAVVDQSDAWAVVSLQGPASLDVLARLVPVDLREGALETGQTLRSQLLHMSTSITKLGSDHFMIMVFRSMAGTLVHDLKQAMAAVAARG